MGRDRLLSCDPLAMTIPATDAPTTEPGSDESRDLGAALRVLDEVVAVSDVQDAPAPAVDRIPDAVWRAVPMSLIRAKLDEAIVGRNPEGALDALEASGLITALLPEVQAMVGMGDSEWRHKDVWKHTKLVVKQSVPRIEVRWGALLHDIGKPRTRKIEEDGSVTFYGHAELGASMFRRKVRARLGFEGELGDRIHFLILHHLRASQYEPEWTDSAVRRFYKQMGEGLRDLLDLSRADITTKRPEKRRRGVHQISELAKRIKSLRSEDEKPVALPKGLGTLLTEVFGIPPSKKLGDIRTQLESDVTEGLLEGGRDCDYYVEAIRADRARFGIDG